MTYPDKYPLSGADRFQIFLDRHHRRYGKSGNISRLVIYLADQPDVELLTDRLNKNQFLKWLVNLKLVHSQFFKIPFWKKSRNNSIEIHVHREKYPEILACKPLIERDINVFEDEVIQFDLLEVDKGWAFVLSWNHIMFDARGAEIIMQSIATETEVPWMPNDTDKFDEYSWSQRLKSISIVKDYLVEKIKPGILHSFKKIKNQPVTWRVVEFNEEETRLIDDQIIEKKAGIIKSIYFLSVVIHVFDQLIENKSGVHWIPVPQDQRKKGQIGPVMSNHVSSMFYCMPLHVDSMQNRLDSLKDQMLHQIRNRMPVDYAVMMDSIKRFPNWLYHLLIARPTKGALASLLFSDTGDSIEGMNYFMSTDVLDATHIPPNSSYPGLTIIFMRLNNKQKIIFSLPKGQKGILDQFESQLRQTLLYGD